MFKELYPSDFTSLTFEKAIQKIPFQSQTKLAIEEMGREIIRLKDEISIYTWTKKGNGSYLIHVSFEKKKLVVHHFLSLFPKEEKETGYRILSQLAKMYRMEEIILKTPKRFIEMEDILKTEKYVYVEDIGYVAKVEYCTGLVLGGGGAKGAYQIGVWHALEEMAIEYQMISGTSVGALNGSLILQGDLQVAENMWESITTDKILSISTQEEEIEYTMNHFLKSWQELTLLAIQSKGISTEPLLDLIERLMRPDVIFSREIDFYVVTTIMSTMEEKVISLNEMTKNDFPHWLLASSSFYPAMMPCLIDGGYRNNIPKDVLVNRGATEIIVVDVSGPGLSKSFKPPETIVETDLKSSWGLGSMLLFDGNRASWNMVLGYLETKKIFGCFSGNDYTFKKKEFKKDCLNLSREFFTFLKTVHPFVEWYDKKTTLKIWEWLIKNNERPETISLLLLESLGKKLDISPIEVYSVESLGEAIQINWCNEENREEESLSDNMLKSLGEWLSVYMREKLPFSDHQLLRYYYSYFNSEEPKNKELFTVLMEVSWMSGLEALFLLFLEKRNV